jgi:predicted phage terminase large subunit-like protein
MDYNYAGQYLQEPVPIGGGEFKPNWIQYYSQGAIKPKEMNVYIMVDPSAGEESNRKRKKLSDWTAFMVVGLAPDNNMYLLEVVRDRLNPTERIETLFMLHRKWNAVCGKPPKVGYEKYGMMTDTHYIELKKREDAYHFPLIELGGSQSKEDRIRRLIPDMNMGRWYFPNAMDYIDNEGRRFDLVKEIIDSEMATFPRSRHDDCLDALSRIYDMDMVFPRPKQNMVEKAIKASYNANRGSTSWEDF